MKINRYFFLYFKQTENLLDGLDLDDDNLYGGDYWLPTNYYY